MNNEIKEILDILKKCKDYDDEVYLIKQHGATLLLDYINNLYLDNTMLKLEKDIYKQGYEELKGLLSSLQNGSENNV